MRGALRVSILCSLFPVAACLATTGPWQENQQSRVRLITTYAAAPRAGAPDADVWLGVEFALQPHWHAYWKNSGDAGFAPALVMKSPEVQGAELLFPAPRRFELPGGLMAFGYEEHVVYPVRSHFAGAAGRLLSLRASVDYVVCADECVPYRYDLVLEQPLADAAVTDDGSARLLRAAAAQLPRSEQQATLHASARLDPGERGELALTLDIPVPAAAEADLFFLPHDTYRLGKPQRIAAESAASTRFRVPLSLRQLPAPALTAAVFSWTATGLLVAGKTIAVEGTTTATPAPGSVFPGIVLWPLAGAIALGLVVWAVVARGPRQRTHD